MEEQGPEDSRRGACVQDPKHFFMRPPSLFFSFTLVTGPRRSLCLKLSDATVYEPQIRARLGIYAHGNELIILTPSHPIPIIRLGTISPEACHRANCRRLQSWEEPPCETLATSCSSFLPSSLELSDTHSP